MDLKKLPSFMEDLHSVKGKTAIITGASGGLGHMIAAGLALAGANVMMTGRSEDKLAPLAMEIRALGGSVAYSIGDPAVHDDVLRNVADTVEEFGNIDILVTSAGTNKPGLITEQPVEEWEMIMDANVKGTYLFCKEVGDNMIKTGTRGKVILVGSARGHLGMARYSAYSPAKGAVHLLTKSLACEWGQHGINVNSIAPTVFRTALTQWMFEDDAFYKNFLKRIPIGRLGEPEDFIGPVLFLSSRASDFLTGAIIDTDGGYMAG
ncbi:MAG: SDR family oxidoreductase [bacterium]|nr:SDR family oxidoreductase [bacterium]